MFSYEFQFFMTSCENQERYISISADDVQYFNANFIENFLPKLHLFSFLVRYLRTVDQEDRLVRLFSHLHLVLFYIAAICHVLSPVVNYPF